LKQVERAVVLAAGLGTRLKWLTTGQPKAMMDVAGEAAIVHVIRRLAAQGIYDIAINTHHHADRLTAFLGDGSKYGVRLYFSYEDRLLDSGGGVRKAMELLPGNGPFVVHNADVLADVDLDSLVQRLPEDGAVLAMVNNPHHHPHGDFGLLQGVVVGEREPGYTYSGISIWSEEAFSGFAKGEAFSLTVPMRQLMGDAKLTGVLHHGQWFDIGRPRDLMMARRFMSREGR